MFSFFISSCGTMLKTLSNFPGNEREAKTAGFKNVIVLRTNDVVNADLARSWCEENGLVLRATDQRDELFPADAGAVVIDLDQLALRPSERGRLVERLSQVLPTYPVAVASYDLDPHTIGSLRARGVLVFRRIERHLFYRLATALDREVGSIVA